MPPGLKPHIQRVEELLLRYGNPQAVPQFLFMFVDIAWPEQEEEDYEEDEPAEPELEAVPSEVGEEIEPRADEVTEEELGCEGEIYGVSDMEEWIRLYWEDRARFSAYRLNGSGLLCGMGTGSSISGEEAERRVESMRSIVAHSLFRLNTLILRATSRAQIVYDLRQSIFPTDPGSTVECSTIRD